LGGDRSHDSREGEHIVHRCRHAARRWIVAGPGLMVIVLLLAGCGGGDGGGAATTSTTLGKTAIPISNDACLSCHVDFSTTTKGEDPQKFSHDLHLRQRISCSTCHQTVGHGGMPTPPRQVCDDCHGIAMPHPAGFGTAHGKLVVEKGGDVCARCHNVYLHCQECHGLQMPHPEQWTQKHGKIAYPQMQVCSRCHEKSYCLTCHPVEMPHPKDWTRTHGLDVVAKGSVVCVNCHQPKLCTSCHGMPMPHPADWGTAHPAVAKDKPGECSLCHVKKDCDVCHQIHQTHGKGGGQ
jgi:Cytochrome c3